MLRFFLYINNHTCKYCHCRFIGCRIVISNYITRCTRSKVRKVNTRKCQAYFYKQCVAPSASVVFPLFVCQPAEKGMACRTMWWRVVAGAVHLGPSPFHPPAYSKMKKAQLARQLFTHPNEFRSLIQYWLWHEPKRDITALGEHETSGYNRKSMQRCWGFLDQTSRSFAAVIKELDGDLARVVWLFLEATARA